MSFDDRNGMLVIAKVNTRTKTKNNVHILLRDDFYMKQV